MSLKHILKTVSQSMAKGIPRTVRGARRRGWTTVTIKRHEKLSYIGMLMQIDRMIKGRYVARYDNQGGGDLAFELAQDAVMVNLRFG